MFIEQLPVPKVKDIYESKFSQLLSSENLIDLSVDKIMDSIIYDIYNLTEEEIEFIEAQ